MELLLPEVIRLCAPMQIRQFQFKIRHTVRKIDERESLRLQTPLLVKTKRLLIERHAAFQVQHIKIDMSKRKRHLNPPV